MSMRTRRDAGTNATYGMATNPKSGLHFDTSGYPILQNASGTAVVLNNATVKTPQAITLTVSGSTATSGVIASVTNPFGVAGRIIDLKWVITTGSSGTCTTDIGVAADASTSNDGLIDGLSAQTTGSFSPHASGGTNGKLTQAMGATACLNVAVATGNATALVAKLYGTFIPD